MVTSKRLPPSPNPPSLVVPRKKSFLWKAVGFLDDVDDVSLARVVSLILTRQRQSVSRSGTSSPCGILKPKKTPLRGRAAPPRRKQVAKRVHFEVPNSEPSTSSYVEDRQGDVIVQEPDEEEDAPAGVGSASGTGGGFFGVPTAGTAANSHVARCFAQADPPPIPRASSPTGNSHVARCFSSSPGDLPPFPRVSSMGGSSHLASFFRLQNGQASAPSAGATRPSTPSHAPVGRSPANAVGSCLPSTSSYGTHSPRGIGPAPSTSRHGSHFASAFQTPAGGAKDDGDDEADLGELAYVIGLLKDTELAQLRAMIDVRVEAAAEEREEKRLERMAVAQAAMSLVPRGDGHHASVPPPATMPLIGHGHGHRAPMSQTVAPPPASTSLVPHAHAHHVPMSQAVALRPAAHPTPAHAPSMALVPRPNVDAFGLMDVSKMPPLSRDTLASPSPVLYRSSHAKSLDLDPLKIKLHEVEREYAAAKAAECAKNLWVFSDLDLVGKYLYFQMAWRLQKISIGAGLAYYSPQCLSGMKIIVKNGKQDLLELLRAKAIKQCQKLAARCGGVGMMLGRGDHCLHFYRMCESVFGFGELEVRGIDGKARQCMDALAVLQVAQAVPALPAIPGTPAIEITY